MKKLKLTIDDLEVTSFTAEEKREGAGTVNGLSGYPECEPSAYETRCLCTHAEGCYPSLYCTPPYLCAITYYEACMTNEQAYC